MLGELVILWGIGNAGGLGIILLKYFVYELDKYSRAVSVRTTNCLTWREIRIWARYL